MTRCEEIRAGAMGLAALAAGDPDRDAAYDHARGCAGCTAALADGAKLLAEVEALPPRAAPTREALERTAAALLARFRVEGAGGRRLLAIAVAAILASWLGISLARSHPGMGPPAWGVAALLGAIGSALAALAPSRARAALGMALLGSAAAAALVSSGGGQVDLQVGLTHCASLELATALLPLGVIGWGMATRRLSGGALALAGVAAGGALAGQGAMHLFCPHRGLAHLVAFHAGAVALAALLGAAASLLPALRRARDISY